MMTHRLGHFPATQLQYDHAAATMQHIARGAISRRPNQLYGQGQILLSTEGKFNCSRNLSPVLALCFPVAFSRQHRRLTELSEQQPPYQACQACRTF